MTWEFRVGMKVVCVDDETHDRYQTPGYYSVGELDGLLKGEVYTVADVCPEHGVPNIKLQEIVRRKIEGARYFSGFAPERFRPLIETTEYRSERMSRFIKDVCANPKQVEIVE